MQLPTLSVLEKLDYCIEKLGATDAAIQLGTPSRTVRHWRANGRIPGHDAHLAIDALYTLTQALRAGYDLESDE